MPEEQESEELLSDVQDPAVEGYLEAAIQLPARPVDVTSTPGETMSKLEQVEGKDGSSLLSVLIV